MLNEILKNHKNGIDWYKNWCKTARNKKKTSSFIYNFSQGYLLSKPEIQCITGIYISFNLGWSYSIQLDIAC